MSVSKEKVEDLKNRTRAFLSEASRRKRNYGVEEYQPFYKDEIIGDYGKDVFDFLVENHYINSPRGHKPVWIAWKNPRFPRATIYNLLLELGKTNAHESEGKEE